MKKILLYRLIAFAFLCFVSVVIKSESRTCKVMCSCIPKNAGDIHIVKAIDNVMDDVNHIDYKSEPFLIKI